MVPDPPQLTSGVKVCPTVTAPNAGGAIAPNNPTTPIANKTLRMTNLQSSLTPYRGDPISSALALSRSVSAETEAAVGLQPASFVTRVPPKGNGGAAFHAKRCI